MSDSTSAVRAEINPDHPAAAHDPAAAPRTAHRSSEEAPAAPADPQLRAIKRLLWGLFVLAALAGLSAAQIVFIPLVAALLLSFLFKPLVRRLEYAHVPPPVTAMGVLLLLCGTLVLGGSTVGNSLAAWIQGAPANINELDRKLESLRAPVTQFSEATAEIEEMAEGGADPSPVREPVEVTVRESAVPTTALNITTTILAGLVITLVMVFFFLASGDLLLRQLVQALPSLTDKKQAVEAFSDLESHVSIYLLTVTLINAGLAGVVGTMLWLLGVPHAAWWGVTAGVANFIPYMGPLVSAVLILAASILAFDTLGQALLPLLLFIVVTSIEGYFITPTVLGRRLSLNPLVVFVWLVFWGWLWGIPGALLAVPLLLCLKIVCDHIDALEPLSHLLSGYVRRLSDNQPSEETAETPQPQS